MNILQVTPRYPPQSGGVETHVKEISERLVDRGHEVTVVTADAGMEGERREVRNGVSVRRYRSLAPGDAMHVCPQITAAVRRSDVDVVHAHNYHSFPLFFAALGVDDRKFVVTTHYHGGSASSVRDRLLSLYRPFGRWAVRRADEVIAVSEWEQKQLCKSLDVDSSIIPNGIQRDRFLCAEPFEREKSYILCVGRLKQYKGIQYAIRSLPRLEDRELIVVGSGPYRCTLEAAAADVGVADRVIFLGYVDDDRLPMLYTGADVHLQLSGFEAYGMTVAESIAAGTPVVVREAGALVDWLESVGTIGVADLDSSTIATAVEAATAGPSPDPYTILDWDQVVDRQLKLYQSRR